MLGTRDVSNLLGRAGFTLLTVDVDDVVVSYPSIFELLEDLKNMGEGNAIIGRYVFDPLLLILTDRYFSRNFLHRDTLLAASAAYQGEARFQGRGAVQSVKLTTVLKLCMVTRTGQYQPHSR